MQHADEGVHPSDAGHTQPMAAYQPRPPQRQAYRGIQVDGLQLALRQEQKATEEQGPGKAMRQATYRSDPSFPAPHTPSVALRKGVADRTLNCCRQMHGFVSALWQPHQHPKQCAELRMVVDAISFAAGGLWTTQAPM